MTDKFLLLKNYSVCGFVFFFFFNSIPNRLRQGIIDLMIPDVSGLGLPLCSRAGHKEMTELDDKNFTVTCHNTGCLHHLSLRDINSPNLFFFFRLCSAIEPIEMPTKNTNVQGLP